MDTKGGGWVMPERFGALNCPPIRSSLSLRAYSPIYVRSEEWKTWVAMGISSPSSVTEIYLKISVASYSLESRSWLVQFAIKIYEI